MSNRRVLHVTNPGLKPQLIAIAPDGAHSPSKRYGLIENEVCMMMSILYLRYDSLIPAIYSQERNLDRNLADLEAGTKARNREFQDRLVDLYIKYTVLLI